jgi:enoyl-CoA hydratase/carnithine racemase
MSSAESPSTVGVERDGAVAVVRMNRPKANAMSPDFVTAIADAVEALGEDRSVRCIVLASAIERFFMAGADIGMMAGGGMEIGSGDGPTFLERFSVPERVPKPVIAAISGHALGGGCELALCCDYRYMVDDGRSTIGLTETSLGILPGAGGTQRLPRLVGRARGLQMILEATRLRAPEALAIGLVDASIPPDAFEAAVMDRARSLASLATRALGCAKRAVIEGLDRPIADGLRAEMRAFLEVFQTADAAEGLQAFLQKRPAEFKGE